MSEQAADSELEMVEEEILLRTRPTWTIGFNYYVLTALSLIVAAFAYYTGPVKNIATASGFVSESRVDALVARISADETVAIFFLFLALFYFVRAEIRHRGRTYEIRRDRVARTDGILRKAVETIPYGHIEEVRIRQGIINRIFNTGTLTIDTGDEMIEFESIPQVKKAQSLVIQRMNAVALARHR